MPFLPNITDRRKPPTGGSQELACARVAPVFAAVPAWPLHRASRIGEAVSGCRVGKQARGRLVAAASPTVMPLTRDGSLQPFPFQTP